MHSLSSFTSDPFGKFLLKMKTHVMVKSCTYLVIATESRRLPMEMISQKNLCKPQNIFQAQIEDAHFRQLHMQLGNHFKG